MDEQGTAQRAVVLLRGKVEQEGMEKRSVDFDFFLLFK
jgi:hypothetical protein